MAPSTNVDLDWLFTYHPPKPEQLPKYERVRAAAKEFARVLIEETPQCADQTSALRHIRVAVMEGNQAIACEGATITPQPPSKPAKPSQP